MALRAVPDHPKFADLKQRLDFPKYAALGCLESLWHFTGKFTPQGNIGKYQDSQIEAWLEWRGEPGKLIESLVLSRWLDRDSVHRLLVHDWHTHADKATKQALNRLKQRFCVPTVHTVGAHVPTIGTQNSVLSSLPVPVPVPEPVPVKTSPTPSKIESTSDDQLREVSDAFDRHMCHSNREPREIVIQNVLSMNGKFTWEKFRTNHPNYCEYWSQKGWNFCKVTFMGWVNAGMPSAPGVAAVTPASTATPPGPCGKCSKDPCQCHRVRHARMMEDLDRAKTAKSV